MFSQNKLCPLQCVLLSWWGGVGGFSVKSCINTQQTYPSSYWKETAARPLQQKKGKRKGKNEQLQLLRKQSMPISHYSTSTSTFFKGINLKLKWKTSCFRSAPKIFERQLLNQNTAPPFFLSFPLLCWGFLNDSAVGLHQGCLQGCAILSFNLPFLRLSSVRHASLIFMENEAHDINLVCFFAETWEQMWKVQTVS